jgi:hypothetical protein
MTITDLSTCSTNVGTCFFSGNTVTVNVNLSISGGNNITTLLTLVQNPLTTVASSSFSISTYYDTSNSLVDQLTSGLTFTATPTPLKAMSVTPGDLKVMDITNYTFNVYFTNPVPAGALVLLTFPVAIPLSTVTYANNNTLSCIATINLQTVNLSGCFPTNLQSPVTFTLNGIQNPSSTKPTDTFNLTTTFSGVIVEYLSAAVTTSMTIPMSFSSLGLSATNMTVNALTSYMFSLQSVTAHTTGDLFLITIPSELSMTSPHCTLLTGITTFNCSFSGSVITLNLTGSSIASTINFTVSNFLNNWYSSPSTFTIQSTTNDVNLYYK